MTDHQGQPWLGPRASAPLRAGDRLAWPQPRRLPSPVVAWAVGALRPSGASAEGTGVKTGRRGALCSVVLWLVFSASACAPRGSSFETLGIPFAGELSGQGAIVVGWAHEARDGWSLDRLYGDEEALLRQWPEATQTPAVVRLDPGEHRLRLTATRRGRGGAVRRYKIRPVSLTLTEAEVRLCVVSLSGRSRPRMRCSHYLGPRARRRAPETPRARPERTEGDLTALFERLERIERQLEVLTERLPAAKTAPREPQSPSGACFENGVEVPCETPPAKTGPAERPPRDLKKIRIW